MTRSLGGAPRVDTCEGCSNTDRPTLRYLVTGHDDVMRDARWCEDCADLARIDWTGEIASIELIDGDELSWSVIDNTLDREATFLAVRWRESNGRPHHTELLVDSHGDTTVVTGEALDFDTRVELVADMRRWERADPRAPSLYRVIDHAFRRLATLVSQLEAERDQRDAARCAS